MLDLKQKVAKSMVGYGYAVDANGHAWAPGYTHSEEMLQHGAPRQAAPQMTRTPTLRLAPLANTGSIVAPPQPAQQFGYAPIPPVQLGSTYAAQPRAATQPSSPARTAPDKTHVLSNLAQRFPTVEQGDIEAVLHAHSGHAGRAAVDLEQIAAATPQPAHGLSEEKIRMAFKLFDRDGSGAIGFREFTAAVEALGVLVSDNLSEEELRAWYSECDVDGSGFIEFPEFQAMIHSQWGQPTRAGRIGSAIVAEMTEPAPFHNSRYRYEQAQRAQKAAAAAAADPWDPRVRAQQRVRQINQIEKVHVPPIKNHRRPKKQSSSFCVVQ